MLHCDVRKVSTFCKWSHYVMLQNNPFELFLLSTVMANEGHAIFLSLIIFKYLNYKRIQLPQWCVGQIVFRQISLFCCRKLKGLKPILIYRAFFIVPGHNYSAKQLSTPPQGAFPLYRPREMCTQMSLFLPRETAVVSQWCDGIYCFYLMKQLFYHSFGHCRM